MSIYSDYKVGALSDSDYKFLAERENRRERAYIDDFERYAYEDEDLVIDEDEDEYPYGYCPWQE